MELKKLGYIITQPPWESWRGEGIQKHIDQHRCEKSTPHDNPQAESRQWALLWVVLFKSDGHLKSKLDARGRDD